MRFLAFASIACGGLALSWCVTNPARAEALAVSSTGSAASAARAFQAAPLFDPKSLSLKALPNGVRGVVRVANGSGLVSVQVWVKAGARHESDSNNGVSHLLAEAGMNGSQNYPRRVEAGGTITGGARESLEALGADAKTFTSRDATFYSVTIASQYLPQALRALSDAVLRPSLTDGTIVEQRVEVASQQRRRENDALDASADIAYRLAFEKHPYRKPAGGSAHSLEGVTGTQVRTFHKDRFVGPNISVVVVGDTSPQTAHKLIGQFFADARPATPDTSSKTTPEVAPPSFKTLSRRFATRNKIITLAFRAPGMANPSDVVAADLLLAHWKEGQDARLRALLLGPDDGTDDEAKEDEENNATSAPALAFDVDYLTQRDPGLMTVTLVVSPDARSGNAIDVVMGEIEKVQRDGLSDAELARARRALTRQYVQQSDSVSGQAGAIGFYEMIGDYNFALSYLDRIAGIKSDDVRRVAQKYLSRTSYVQVIAEPIPRPKPDTPPLEGGSGSITALLHLHVP